MTCLDQSQADIERVKRARDYLALYSRDEVNPVHPGLTPGSVIKSENFQLRLRPEKLY